jgi:putative ABC transport system permease protein
MNWMRQLLFRRRLYNDLSAEIQEHLEEKAAELIAAGMPRAQAMAAARREFGNCALLEERGREVWQWRLLESLWRDVRLVLRHLRHHPGFTVTVVLTLALAIGANTAVFSMVDALLLRALPYPEPQRLAAVVRNVHGTTPSGQVVDEIEDGQDGETWELIRHHVTAARFAAEYHGADGVNLEANHQVRYVLDHRVSAAYFDVLGIRPLLGRSFTQEEDTPHGPNAVVLSYELWRSLFSADRNILGTAIRLKGEPYTVVGVMPPDIQTTAVADLWTPVRPWRGGEGGGPNYHFILRLRHGSTWAELNAQLKAVRPSSFNRFFKGANAQLFARPLQQDLADEKRASALMLMISVALILVIACINIAGLMLVRLHRRNDEIATRLALGATRTSIVQQTVMEPLVLTVLGAVAGVLLAYLALGPFISLFPADMLPVTRISIDFRVLLFTTLCAAMSALFMGLFPAFATRHMTIRPSLGGRVSTARPHSSRTRHVFIAAEVCLTLVLLAGAGVLVRTLLYLETLPPGFDPSNVKVAKASLDDARFRDPADFRALLERSIAALRQIPGVETAAVGLGLPYERGLNNGFRIVDGPTAGLRMGSSMAYVTPDYFSALRIPVLAGRVFTDNDTSENARVAIINASFARKFFRSMDVIGRHIDVDDGCVIVGLVGDVTKEPGIQVSAPLATEPMIYVPATQVSGPFLSLVHTWFQPSWIIRTRGPILGLKEQIRKALEEAAPGLPFSALQQMSDLQAKALAQQRLEVMLLTALAALALLLSLIGVYGLVSNLVAQRRREIGIRMALGCTLSQAMTKVGRSGVVAVSFGLAAGLGVSAFALRLMRNQLFGVRSADPATVMAACLLLLLAACAASFLPTLRIARINPATTLRAE